MSLLGVVMQYNTIIIPRLNSLSTKDVCEGAALAAFFTFRMYLNAKVIAPNACWLSLASPG